MYSLLMRALLLWLIQIESGSMQPTLKIGDVVAVRKVSDIWDPDVGYTNGTIVAFWGDPIMKPGEIIVHRLVDIGIVLPTGPLILMTHGDNNPYGAVEHFSEEYLIGEVIAIISESS